MNKQKLYPITFALGALSIYCILFVAPSILGIAYSFTDWSSYVRPLKFVGLENYLQVFSTEESYTKILMNTAVFTVVTTILKNVLGLALALLLTNKCVKLLNLHRGIMYMPSVLSILVLGMVFKTILNPATGLLNQSLDAVGLGFLQQQWLTNPKIAFGTVIAVDIWRGMGYVMTILIAGILSIPSDYMEAAAIDGVSALQRIRYIIIPLIMPTLTTVTVLNVIYGLKVFDMIYVLTNGGPGRATTEVLYTAVFKLFGTGQYALGTALSSVMFIFMATIGWFLIKFMTRNGEEE